MVNYAICKKCKKKMYGVKKGWADYCYDCTYNKDNMPQLPKIKRLK